MISPHKSLDQPLGEVLEDRKIRVFLDRIVEFWRDVDLLGCGPKYEEMAEHLRELHEILTDHCQKVERQLLPMQSVKQARRGSQIETFRDEQVELLERLAHDRELVQRHCPCEELANWTTLGEEISTLVELIISHLATERELLESLRAE
ncbi:MAG: hemerythrin domain-containing protein [Planctomycetaceae bacterium]|nr:hemerythrin domain-containing protein [Planctomycetaceae bacterium]